ncbi:unnamed protein product [Phytophthora fragariaefolia]|uniref:Unnamed protein product n=1 Tax=Phytophthora fragariaefolia TaxID=1490495 RepID=A0A9W6Y3U4_9STRA|nr:unnamed protein product [Phytophthora fragariaefolia]
MGRQSRARLRKGPRSSSPTLFENALNESYLAVRRQQNLITDMRSTCTTVADTKWLSTYGVTISLFINKFRVRSYLSKTGAPCTPKTLWWIFLYALRKLQKKPMLFSSPCKVVERSCYSKLTAGLAQRFCSVFGMIGPLTQEKLAALEATTREIIGNCAISHTAPIAHIQQLDLWVYDNIQTLDAGQKDVVFPVVAQMTNSRRGKLNHKFDEAPLHNIVAEFIELRREYDVSNKFRQAVKEFDKLLATFDDMWAVGDAANKFPTLAEFCGAFASAVESDFSVINCEKSDKRTSLTDITLSKASFIASSGRGCLHGRSSVARSADAL